MFEKLSNIKDSVSRKFNILVMRNIVNSVMVSPVSVSPVKDRTFYELSIKLLCFPKC